MAAFDGAEFKVAAAEQKHREENTWEGLLEGLRAPGMHLTDQRDL